MKKYVKGIFLHNIAFNSFEIDKAFAIILFFSMRNDIIITTEYNN